MTAYIVILDIDAQGPIYLGRLDCGNQGVRRIENVNVYTERGARNLAAQYDRAVAAPYPSLLAR